MEELTLLWQRKILGELSVVDLMGFIKGICPTRESTKVFFHLHNKTPSWVPARTRNGSKALGFCEDKKWIKSLISMTTSNSPPTAKLGAFVLFLLDHKFY